MAEIEASFVTDLKSRSTITTYVGSRIYAYRADNAAKEPYIIVRVVDDPRSSWTQTLYGGVARISLYVYDSSESRARTIGEALLAVYQQFHGTLGGHIIEGTEVSNARFLDGPDNEFRYLVDLVFTYH